MESDEGDPAENLCNLRKEGRQMAATRLIAMHKNKGRSMEGKLVKITKWLAILFMVLSILLNLPLPIFKG